MLRSPAPLLLVIAMLLGSSAQAARGDEAPGHAAPRPADLAAAAKAADTVNSLCPVMERPVTPTGGSVEYQDEKIGFCCPMCAGKFRAETAFYMDRLRLDPAKYAYASSKPTREVMAKAAAEAQSANARCPVMGGLVSPRGGNSAYAGQTIAFCCPGCKGKFDADPEGYMRVLRADPLAYGYERPGPTSAELHDARVEAQAVNGLCPVQGRLVTATGGSSERGGEKVAFCCPGCKARFEADAQGYLRKMRAEPAAYGYVPAK